MCRILEQSEAPLRGARRTASRLHRCHRALAFAGVMSICWSCAAPRPAGIADPGAVPWSQLASPTDASLRGLSVVSTSVAWSTGEHGTWLRTIDGGATWQHGTVPANDDPDLRDVQAFDGDSAVVMAIDSPARIWRTADAGATWSLVYENTHVDVFLDGMAFADEHRGYAFSDPVDGAFLVIATDDGGRSWTPLAGLPAPLVGEAGFAAGGSAIAARGQHVWIGTGGAGPRVLRSVDGGRTWTAANVPMCGGAPTRGLFSLAFRDLRNGVAVGGDYAEPDADHQNAAFTADGGRTWHAVPGRRPSGYRSAVAYLPAASPPTCFAVGPNGIDASRDGGLSWSRISDQGFHALAFAPDSPAGFAVGSGGRIARYDATLPLAAGGAESASATESAAKAPTMAKLDYSTPVTTLDGRDTDLTDHRGQVLLIVNTASKCGFTPQFAGLQALYERFQDRGFAVLGFPCNQFGGQEPGAADEIGEFCQRNYGVTFPMHAKIDVNGEGMHPLFEQLQSAAPGLLGTKSIKWNFTKFLVDRDGEIIERFAPRTSPESIASRIEELLDRET